MAIDTKNIKLNTQKIIVRNAVLKFPTLGDEPNAFGKIGTQVLLDPDKHADTISTIKSVLADASNKTGEDVRPLLSEETDRDGNKTGQLLFKLNFDPTKKEGSPLVFNIVDTKNNQLPMDVKKRISTGSVVNLNLWPTVYSSPAVGTGVKLRINAIQLLELKEFGGSGFDVVDEGYVFSGDTLPTLQDVIDAASVDGDVKYDDF